MSTSDRVLVVGGTRGTGQLIVGLLRQRGYRVRVLARNLVKGNTLVWRRRVEEALRASRVDTIIRLGFLMNGAPSRRAIDIGQRNLPLAFRYRISRADAADVFVEALGHPRASRTTFDAVWGKGERVEPLAESLNQLQPDR